MLQMSSKPSHAERFYNAMADGLKGKDGKTAYSLAPGSRMDGFIYAAAMQFARGRYALEHAGHEMEPARVTENIATREEEYGAFPAADDNLATRRAVLMALRLLPLGCAQANMENALLSLLPDDFLAYLPTELGTEINAPVSIGDDPMNLQREDLPNVLLQTIDGATASFPASYTLRFDALDPETSTVVEGASTVTSLRLSVGDKVVVNADAPDMAEVVTVTAVGISAGPPAYRTFTATFTKPHPVGSALVVGDWPYWHSTKRFVLVILSMLAAVDAEKRRKVDALMGLMSREVTQWQIAGGTGSFGSGTAGPFLIGVSGIGTTPFGLVTF
jgi:hypothetical protein